MRHTVNKGSKKDAKARVFVWPAAIAVGLSSLAAAFFVEALVASAGTYVAALLATAVLAILFLGYDRFRRGKREALERSEERYELAIRGANDGIWDWNLVTGEMHFSPRWKAMMGFEEHEIADRFEAWEERVHPDDRERMAAAIRECVRGETGICEVEHRLRHRDGSYRWMLARGASVRDADGRTHRMAGSLTDTTKRKEVEERLQSTEERYRSLVEQAPMVTFVYTREPDGSTHVSYVSPQIEALIGYSSERFERDPEFWMSLLHPGDLERVMAETDRTDGTGETFEMEYRMVHKDGRAVWVREETALIGSEEDGTTRWRGVYVDLTERREAEEELRKTETRYRRLVEQMPAATYVESSGQPSNLVYTSPQIEALFGYTLDDYANDPGLWIGMIHPDDRERVLTEDERARDADEPFFMEYRQISRDGRVIWTRDECVPIRDDEGNTLFWQGVLLDITDRKEAEEKLQEAETRYRTLVERVPAITYVHAQEPGEHSATDYISPQIETVLGYTTEEYAGDPEFWKTVLHPEDRERVLAEDERTGETGDEFRMDFRVISKSGETVWLREDGRLLRSEDGQHQLWHGIMFDITELKRAEEGLRHRYDFEKIIADASAKFVDLAPAELDRGMEEVLREIGEFSGADRSYVFLCSEDGTTLKNTHEWCAGGIVPQIENLERVPADAWPWAMKKFRNGEVSHVPCVADLPAEASAEKEECEAEDIQSFVQIPLLREGSLVGFVGFDAVRSEREWSEDEISLLKTVGELFTNTLERRRVERVLREAEGRYRSLIENIPAVTYIHPAGDSAALSYMSPQIQDMLGYTAEEYISEPGFWMERLHPDDRERVIAEDERSDETLAPFSIEYRLRSREGRYQWVREEGVVVWGDEGNPEYWQGFLWNISDRKEAEEKLQEAEARYRSLIEHTPMAVYRQEIEHGGAMTYMSPRVEEILGYAAESYLRDPGFWVDTMHPDDRERVLAEDERTDRTGEPFEVEHRAIHSDGRTVWVRNEAVLIRDDRGRPRFWQGVVSDITEHKEAEEKLQESEARYRTLVEHTPAITYTETVSDSGVTSYVSSQVERILGYSIDEMDEKDPFWGLLHPEDRERVVAADERANETGEPFGEEYRMFRKDGRVVWVRDEAMLVSMREDGTQHWQGVIYDITDRKEAETKLQEAEARYRTLIEQIPAVTYIQEVEHNDTILYVSPQMEALTGYAPEDFYSDRELWYGITHPEDFARMVAEDERTDETGETFEMEYRMIHKDGRVVWVRDEALLVQDAEGRPRLWQGVMSDITDRKELEDRLKHQAMHDALTGLPNRALFRDRLTQALARSGSGRGEEGGFAAVLFLDLDNFKVVNDSLGHEAGDRLLVEAALRLSGCLRSGDTAARLGGDEFTVLLEGSGLPEDAEVAAGKVAERIARALKSPFMLGEQEVFVSASIGIAVISGDEDAEDLLRDADAAMYWAKRMGKSGYQVFDHSMNAAARERLALENDLRRALEREDFFLHYQPKMSLGSERIVGVEALLRWEHPERGFVSPGEFIPVAEDTGLIVPLGKWVLREACRQVVQWEATLPDGYPAGTLAVAVNLSAKQFLQRNLARDVARVLRETGLAPERLILEITETVVMDETSLSMEAMRDLKSLGIRLSIDDFGKGHSSLSYLKRIPADYLKIDRSFVDGLGRDAESTAIVSAMINLSHELGLTVVAEGIETADQLERLKALGCELGQGYHLAKPLAAADAAEMLVSHRRLSA